MSGRATRIKRLKIRSWRRGTKEMDLILGTFFDDRCSRMTDVELDEYEALLAENDQDLYRWYTGQADTPATLSAMLSIIRAHHIDGIAKI